MVSPKRVKCEADRISMRIGLADLIQSGHHKTRRQAGEKERKREREREK